MSRGNEVGAREEHEEGASWEPKRRGEMERKMERMGHDASQPATSAVRGTRPCAEQRRELRLPPAHGGRSFIRAVLKKRFSLWTILSLIPVHIIDDRFFIPLLVSPTTRPRQRSDNGRLQKARMLASASPPLPQFGIHLSWLCEFALYISAVLELQVLGTSICFGGALGHLGSRLKSMDLIR